MDAIRDADAVLGCAIADLALHSGVSIAPRVRAVKQRLPVNAAATAGVVVRESANAGRAPNRYLKASCWASRNRPVPQSRTSHAVTID